MRERDYSEMSPAELNEELSRFLDLVPKLDIHGQVLELASPEFAAIVARSKEREESSELVETLIPRLERLLEQSKGTESFKKFILGRFRGLCLVGQAPADFEGGVLDRVLGKILGVGDLEGGVFSADRVQGFENVSYAMAVFELSFVMTDELGKELGLAGEFGPRYAAWRSEFIEKYGDEPILPKLAGNEASD